MEQIDIKYSDILATNLNIYDIYNSEVSKKDIQKLKEYFQFFIIIIILYVLSLQPKKSTLSLLSINNLRRVILFLFIYTNIILFMQTKFSIEIDNKYKMFYNKYNTNEKNKFYNEYIKYDPTNPSDSMPKDYHMKSNSIINTLIITLKVLIYIFIFILLINISNIENVSGNSNRYSLFYYIIVFGCIFYFIIEYLFANFINKTKLDIENKTNLLNIVKEQKIIDNPNSIEKFKTFNNANFESSSIDYLYGNIDRYNIQNLKEKFGEFQNELDTIYTIEQKKSIINSNKDIIENIENSKLLLTKDNNKYKNEIIYVNELKEIFKGFYFNYYDYEYNHLISSMEQIKNNNYILDTNDTTNGIYLIDGENNLTQTPKFSPLLKENTIGNNSQNLISCLRVEAINNTNIYKLYTIQNNINVIINKLSKLDLHVIKDSIDEIPEYYNEYTGILPNDEKYKNVYNAIFDDKNKNINSDTLTLDTKLEEYIGLDFINYNLLAKIIINNGKQKIDSAAKEDVEENGKKKEVIVLLLFSKIASSFVDNLQRELNFIFDNINILYKIYENNKNEISNLIQIRDVDNALSDSNMVRKTKILDTDDDEIKKKKYFATLLIYEIDLFNDTIKNKPFKEDDIPLMKANKYKNYKFAKYVYEYYTRRIDIILNSLEIQSIENLKLITKEQIYRSFIENLTTYGDDKINKERLLKNYKRLLDDVFKTIEQNADFHCSSKLKLNVEVNKNMSYVNYDVFNNILKEKNLKDVFDELCKLEKIRESFKNKYEPLITYELNNKKEDKSLIVNIINIFIWYLIIVIIIYFVQNLSTGLTSETTVWSTVELMMAEILNKIDYVIYGIKFIIMLILGGLVIGNDKAMKFTNNIGGFWTPIIYASVLILLIIGIFINVLLLMSAISSEDIIGSIIGRDKSISPIEHLQKIDSRTPEQTYDRILNEFNSFSFENAEKMFPNEDELEMLQAEKKMKIFYFILFWGIIILLGGGILIQFMNIRNNPTPSSNTLSTQDKFIAIFYVIIIFTIFGFILYGNISISIALNEE